MSSNKIFSWTQFFREAGIPLPMAKRYALSFDDNRISRDMLIDLSKEILTEMGITAMGDIINILKHSKKMHVQDVKKREKEGIISTNVFSNKRPPAHSPHSTTSGQGAAAVSTTSTNFIKKRVAKQLRKIDELEEDAPEVTYIAYVEPANKELLEPLRNDPEVYTALELHRENEHFLEATKPISKMTDGIRQSYGNAEYETSGSGLKRLGKMYSDRRVVGKQFQLDQQQNQAGVIMLPGEGRDIFTTTALQKAAKVYEAGEDCEGSLATDRSRRLLESAGLIPSKVKDPDHSIFSRLDYKPSVLSRSSLTSGMPKISELSQPAEQRRIIQLSKPSTSTLYSDQLGSADVTSSISYPRKRVISIKPSTKSTTLFSDPATYSVPSKKRVISLRQSPHSTLYSDRLTGSDITSNIPPLKRRAISDYQPLRASGSSLSGSNRLLSSATTTDNLTTTPWSRMLSDTFPRPFSERLGTRERGGEREKAMSSISPIFSSSFPSSIREKSGQVPRLGAETFGGRTGIFGYEREGNLRLGAETFGGRTGIFGYEREGNLGLGAETFGGRTGLFGYEREGNLGGRRDESKTDVPFKYERLGRRDENRTGVPFEYERLGRRDESMTGVPFEYERQGRRDEIKTSVPFEYERQGRRDGSGTSVSFGNEYRGYLGGGRDYSSVLPLNNTALISHTNLKTTMVADEYEYQSRRHHDIRSRLEKKEKEKAARRTGPLGGRLGSHKVFRRLE